jgi:PhnB protein
MAEPDLIEQLDQAVEAILSGAQTVPAPAGPIGELVGIARELRHLPSNDFRAKLKAELTKAAQAAKETKTMTSTTAVKPIREGFHSITPYLIVEGAANLIHFLEQAFGGHELFRVSRPGGSGVMHAEVRIGDSIIELADANPQHPPMPAAIHLYVTDVDTVYHRALEAGGTSAYGVVDQFYGDREASVKDPLGNFWYIATHKWDGSPEQPAANFIPHGLHTVTPYLHPKGTGRMIEFLKQAFDAEDVERDESPDGTVMHAKIRIGDSILEMGEAHGEFGPMPSTIHLYVNDTDATYQRALQAGGTSIVSPSDTPYGDRSAAVTDPAGNHWYIATHIRDVPLSE